MSEVLSSNAESAFAALPPGIVERFIDAEGVRTRYLESGNGSPLILIHGGGAGADSYGNWRRVIPLLAGDHRVIAVDMIGFGRTAKPEGSYSQDRRIDHLTAFIEALELDGPAALVGNSMGGATALGVSVRRPDLVRALVLMGSAGLNVEISKELLPILNYDFTREGMIRLIRALTNDRFEIDEDLVSYRFALAGEADARRAYAATMGWIKEQGGLFYEEDFIRKVDVPTLVINGKQDKVVPLASAFRFLQLIENSWGYIIPHCGHWAMIEHPESFAEATLSFIDQRAGGPR
ncbi:MAG: alpha/beta hydrolase [Bradyrhizobium sp.]|nr:alpha/beta hydrolase [Bradyrhizobium sp.]